MKMNKMYQAPKAEMVELNVNNGFMEGGGHYGTTSIIDESGNPELS